MIKLLPTLFLKLMAIILLIAPYSVKAQCTGFTFNIEDITVTSISPTYIQYNYTIRNTGSTTVSTDNLVLQNYITTNTSGGGAIAAGGSMILGSHDIAPDGTYSGSYQANQSNLPTYPYLWLSLDYGVLGSCQVNLDQEYECLRPDAQFVSFTINNTQPSSISYEFQLKNVGADTLFLSDLLLENFLSANSTYDGADVATGSTTVTISGKTYLLANQSGTVTYTTSGSISGYSYLVTNLTYSEQAECSTGNNQSIESIPALNGILPSSKSTESNAIIWNNDTKCFTISSWDNQSSNEKLSYEIYNTSGTLQSAGTTSIGEATAIKGNEGFYVLIITDGVKRHTKRIVY
jgi:hypothetical protein